MTSIRSLFVPSAFIAVAFGIGASAQSPPPLVEDFDLNIVNERITETNFARSTAVQIDEPNVRLNVGVAVTAERIDVILKGITGRVRFRGSPGSLLQRLRQISNGLK